GGESQFRPRRHKVRERVVGPFNTRLRAPAYVPTLSPSGDPSRSGLHEPADPEPRPGGNPLLATTPAPSPAGAARKRTVRRATRTRDSRDDLSDRRQRRPPRIWSGGSAAR